MLLYHISGYIPEWIQLEKQVRESIEQTRLDLKRTLKTIASENLHSSNEQKTYLLNNARWNKALDKFRSDINEINLNINKLNLVVPMLWRQQVKFNKIVIFYENKN